MPSRNRHDSVSVASAAADHLTNRQHFTLSLLWFALNFQSSALLPIVIPVQILLFVAPGQVGNAQQAAFLAWLGVMTAILALLVTPVAGALSDHTTGGIGRRRPYIALGAVALIVGTTTLANPSGVGALILGLVVLSLGGNIATAGYQGLMPDVVPQSERGSSAGYIGLMTILGNSGSLVVAGLLFGAVKSGADAGIIRQGAVVFYVLTGIVIVGGVLVTLFNVHELPLVAAPPRRALGVRQQFVLNWIAPWRHRDFRWVVLTRGSVMMGLSLFLTFIAYYFANVAHIANFVQVTAALAVLALTGAASSAFVLGQLSDRIGRVGLVCFATACMSAAALAFVVLPPGVPLWPLGLLFGLGFGAYSSVDWALAVDVLPSPDDAGKDMGLWSIASNLPALLAPALGGLVIVVAAAFGRTALGYRAIFALAVVFLLSGAIFILLVRETVSLPRRHIAPGWRLAFSAHGGVARGFLRVWPVYERLWLLFHRVRAIPEAPSGLLLIRFRRYHGRPLTLPDGTVMRRGDRIGELHFDNRAVARIAAQGDALRLLPLLADDLRALAAWAQTPAVADNLRALYGYTLLGRAAVRLGFMTRERKRTPLTWLDRFFMIGLLALYNPRGTSRLRQGATYSSFPLEVWMSRGELGQRYGG
ncbi:MAG: MFS transporter [Ktedonobacterales bacterium]